MREHRAGLRKDSLGDFKKRSELTFKYFSLEYGIYIFS